MFMKLMLVINHRCQNSFENIIITISNPLSETSSSPDYFPADSIIKGGFLKRVG